MAFDTTTIDILKTRLWVYNFLSKAFSSKPDWEVFKDEANLNVFSEMVRVEEENSSDSSVAILAQTLNHMPQWSDKEWKEAQIEYQRLFYGPGPLPAKPWESVYLSRERIILDEHTLEVRAFYKNWGFEMNQLNKEPDDFIGVELEFLANLTLMAINLMEEGNAGKVLEIIKAQGAFLEEHLLKWVDEFCKALSENTANPIYKGIALFTPEFLHMDDELLKDLAID